jgi:hypothetical protein
MSTEVERDLGANPVAGRLAARVVQVDRAKVPASIRVVVRWVDYRVLMEVRDLRENRANMALEVTMASLVRQTVRSTQPIPEIAGNGPGAATLLPISNRPLLINTALHGIGSGTTARTLSRKSVSRTSEIKMRIMPLALQNRLRRLFGNASK